MSRRSPLRVQDILDAIDRIDSDVADMDYEHFLADRKTQDAVTRNIEIIGEAGSRSAAIPPQNDTRTSRKLRSWRCET